MQELKIWASADNTETIEYIFGYYKLFTNHQMIPIGKTLNEAKDKLEDMGRNDISANLKLKN